MFAVIAAHLCAAIIAPALVDAMGRRALAILAAIPASALIYALWHSPTIMAGGSITNTWTWIPGLALTISLKMDLLGWVMSLIVGGVGAIVLLYASAYFTDASVGLRRFASIFTLFAGVMFGLVLADHTMVLYTFWEATSILSYLLIGHHHERRPARLAARQALLLTSSGALAMFAGLIMLAEAPGGSYRISILVANAANGTLDTSSPLVIVATFLVLAGALSKSAQLPFHFWLPGAMTAPTPVSAYLHAAAMVKAGVYLIARLTPGFVQVPAFSPVLVIFGLVTMCLGALRALRQYDLKLLLAHGTVSQLGLIIATIAQGSAAAMTAGLVMLVSHATFKSALFLTVGAIEQATGRRDWRRLSGVGRRKPVLAAAGAVALASMAGIPLTTGYLGKEALISALLHGSGAAWTQATPWADVLVLVAVALGSTLTVAYAWRAWWGAFGTRPLPDDEDICRTTSVKGSVIAAHKCTRTPTLMVLMIVLLASGALIGLFPTALEHVLSPFGADTLPGSAHLVWWSGWGPALITAAILSVGAFLAFAGRNVERLQERFAPRVALVDLYAWSIHELDIVSARITRLIQRGSLPWDLSVIVVTLVLLVSGVFIIAPPQYFAIRWADSAAQVAIGVVIVLAAILTVRSRGRMRAAILLGAVGLGVALLWASQGAPDLALTQIVVEAVGIVVFVLVLRRLPTYFSDRPLQRSRWWRFALALVTGVGVVATGLYASSARIHDSVATLMPSEALDFGHGKNIVNVILVDIRAWDTVGELSVLLVIATGVAALIHVRSRGRSPRSLPRATTSAATPRFLRGVALLDPRERSTVMEVVTHLLFHTMLVLSVWLLFIGHNSPGGGFVGGVVAGLAFLLRYLAGGRYELAEAMPLSAGRVLGFGLFLAGLGALLPLLAGNTVLESTAIDWSLGVLGEIHFTTAMLLDVGVYVLVIGLVLDLVSTLGSEIDLHAREHTEQVNA
ncbi:Na+/H+ antiporter subunit A [Schaalia suimastitidis]|uniref:Na+/H+ antiporter subunit A n=1 Tax=Schaalia suimastitidis TaxID=121163 RepID=UPI00041F82C1|nr:Na+/H+ antiporter subunit A [Schaalia suimastitidis]